MAVAPQHDDLFPESLTGDFYRVAMTGSGTRAPRLRKLDQLIDWYNQFRPGVTAVATGVSRSTVLRWGIKPEERGAPIVYRTKVLLTKAKATDE